MVFQEIASLTDFDLRLILLILDPNLLDWPPLYWPYPILYWLWPSIYGPWYHTAWDPTDHPGYTPPACRQCTCYSSRSRLPQCVRAMGLNLEPFTQQPLEAEPRRDPS